MSDVLDHYEVLGVPRDATTSDIERARRRLALIWHPDRNQSADAAQHFDEVQKAAEVLRDPVARAAYDRDYALRAMMSIPRDLRDSRPPEPPPAPAGTERNGTERPGAGRPGAGRPSAERDSTERGHARPRRRRRASGKARLWAGLVVLVGVAVGIAAVFLTGSGHPAPAVPRPAAAPSASSAPGRTAGSPGTFPLPQYASGPAAVLPVNRRRVLSIGPGITLLAAGGHVVWRETARVGSLNTNPASSGGPHALHGCVVDGSTSGRQYDFISLASGQQAVVAEKQAVARSMALAGDRVALPDGTIRDPCTGNVLGRVAPSGTFTRADCLIGSVVIGTNQRGQMAWKNGHKQWQRHISDPLICDRHGSVVKLSPSNHKISLIDPYNGQPHWTVGDPGCPQHCISSSGSAVQILGAGGAVLFNDADQVFALARGNGKLLWHKASRCALAARTRPPAEALLGLCPGQTSAATGAQTVAATTGSVVGTDTAGGHGCGPGGQWAASSHQLLVVCPGPYTRQRRYRAQLVNW